MGAGPEMGAELGGCSLGVAGAGRGQGRASDSASRSAGVGRTGVFITLSIVLERMRYEGVVDIFQTVKMLRTQRPAMVQTEVGHPPQRPPPAAASALPPAGRRGL